MPAETGARVGGECFRTSNTTHFTQPVSRASLLKPLTFSNKMSVDVEAEISQVVNRRSTVSPFFDE